MLSAMMRELFDLSVPTDVFMINALFWLIYACTIADNLALFASRTA